jgi:hypothetical protein
MNNYADLYSIVYEKIQENKTFTEFHNVSLYRNNLYLDNLHCCIEAPFIYVERKEEPFTMEDVCTSTFSCAKNCLFFVIRVTDNFRLFPEVSVTTIFLKSRQQLQKQHRFLPNFHQTLWFYQPRIAPLLAYIETCNETYS